MARLSPAWRSALREFVIIVAGVLAALAAQAWWSSAQDARREREYLAQLLGDTRENERRLEEAIAVEERAAAATLSAQAALKGPGPAPADSIIEWFNRAGTTSDFQPVTGTYRAIASTGDLRLIRTDTLRTLLTSYAAALESEGARLEQLRGMVLSEISSFARALPFMHGVFSGTVDPAGVDVRTLRGDPEVSVVVFTMQAAIVNRLAGLRRLERTTERLRRALESEPGAANHVNGRN